MSQSPSSVEPSLGEIEAFLQLLIADCQPEWTTPANRGRPRILPGFILWTGLVVCILRGFTSQLDLWRLLSHGRFWDYPRYPISDQAVYHRLARDGTAPIARLFDHLSQLLAKRLAPFTDQTLAPFARCVVALDESALDPVARRLPALRGVPAEEIIPGKVAGLFDLRLQQWRKLRFHPDYRANEKVLAREMIAELPAGSLILADLGYFGFAWFDELTAAHQYWVSKLRKKTSYRVVHVLYQQGEMLDALVWLGVHRADRARYLVRLVQVPYGKQTYRYLTNVLDPEQLPVQEVVRLYQRRWDIEMAFQLVKQHLGLSLLWSANPVVIQQQLWAVLIIAQLLQALRMEIAARAGVDLFDVSMPLLVRYLPQYARYGHDPLAAFLEDGVALGFIRASRRIKPVVDQVDLANYCRPPPELETERIPRYANGKCGSR